MLSRKQRCKAVEKGENESVRGGNSAAIAGYLVQIAHGKGEQWAEEVVRCIRRVKKEGK